MNRLLRKMKRPTKRLRLPACATHSRSVFRRLNVKWKPLGCRNGWRVWIGGLHPQRGPTLFTSV